MGRGLKRAVCLGAVICTLAVAVGADPLVGLWASPPDGKGQTGIVQIKPCGDAYCGTLIKAFDPNGKQIVTKNVGKRLLWGMKPMGGGLYGEGRVFVPIFGRDYPAEVTLSGTRMTVKGCAALVCKAQKWRRAQ
ncbi:MAG: DUF2147 domain-containing protein [Marinovum algicola]|jgi:uncharacterized protein (DUF2147 family)|uniref:DUF2147 domain-containing protein n=1 Tax=Marinovum algicola TaxID=42444 RepID=A0A975ZPG2_9RHOB|nr:DUF2147 domain-containing protein [Marinovum algicola]SEJ86699.1 hypothetical protein SAMN04487940_11259 [Marinovum algicola]SLN67256.1 hypothetical protein MAA5396_03622 [Marinovum algicola]